MSRRRLQALALAVGALVVPLLAVSAGSTQAQPAPAVPSARATAPDHPYSKPIYYPVRQPMKMDCYFGNAGCEGKHKDYQLSLRTASPVHLEDDHVYAMGAGRIDAMEVGKPCDPKPGPTTFGTQIDIDHGGGVSTRYGHLSDFAPGLKEGDYVDAGQWIGVMGNTGAHGGSDGDCAGASPYVDFWIKDDDHQVDFKTLEVCTPSGQQTWPADQYPAYKSWKDVPQYQPTAPVKAIFPALTNPLDVPDGSCIPPGAPATPDQPAEPRLDRAGSKRLTASWTGQPAGTSAVVELQVYRVSSKEWLTEEYAKIPAGTTSHTFSDNLVNGGQARIRLNYVNDVGASAATDWVVQTVGAPPEQPISRGVSADVRGGSAFIRLSWKPGERNGFEPTGWTVEIRKGSGAWKAKTMPAKTYSYKWDGLKKKTAYQVRVAALSAAGPSPYLTKSVTTPKK